MHFKHVFKLSPRGKNGRNKLIGRPFTCLRILGISFQSAVVARGYLLLGGEKKKERLVLKFADIFHTTQYVL